MAMKMVAAVLAVVLGVSAPVAPQSATPAQRPPVFRAGAHYVRVDAYPTRDGRIIEGLTKDDFEILSTHGSSTAGGNHLRSGCRSCKVDRTTNGSWRSSWRWRHSAVATTWSSSLSAPMA